MTIMLRLNFLPLLTAMLPPAAVGDLSARRTSPFSRANRHMPVPGLSASPLLTSRVTCERFWPLLLERVSASPGRPDRAVRSFHCLHAHAQRGTPPIWSTPRRRLCSATPYVRRRAYGLQPRVP